MTPRARRDSHQRLHCALFVVEDAEYLHQAGDVEDLLDLRVRAYEVDGAAVLAYALEPADQNAQSGGVDVANLLEVDHEIVVLLVDQLGDRILDLRRRVDVDLAGEVDHVRVPLRRADVDFDIHGYSS